MYSMSYDVQEVINTVGASNGKKGRKFGHRIALHRILHRQSNVEQNDHTDFNQECNRCIYH